MHEQMRESLAATRSSAGRRSRSLEPQDAVPATPARADRLRDGLRQRLIAFYLMPSEADRWIDIWTTTVADGDPCSTAYWDRGFRWILTAVDGNAHDRAVPCGNVDPALAAVITRGFRG